MIHIWTQVVHLAIHHSLSHLSSFLLPIHHYRIPPRSNSPLSLSLFHSTHQILFRGFFLCLSDIYCMFMDILWGSIFVYICVPFVCCLQGRLFTVEEDSVTSGRGRSPYDPNSPCTSTLSSKTLLNQSITHSNQLWLKVQL